MNDAAKDPSPIRIGLLWRSAQADRADALLGHVFDRLSELGVETERVVYSDDRIEETRRRLLGLDGVLVWVNPIQDGANRVVLDQLLRDVSASGVWVSAHPDVIAKLGTKEVLYHTRNLGWGSDVELYRSAEELAERLPHFLAAANRIVLKQARGNGGDGVWLVESLDASTRAAPSASSALRIQHALSREASFESTTLGEFLDRCSAYFAWSGAIVAQPYQTRLADGMIRCYFVQDRVAGFCHQWPAGLLDAAAAPDARRGTRSPMEGVDAAPYQALRAQAESDWVPAMQRILDLETHALPVIWDADFLYGPRDSTGQDTFVLCEINISCVWPFPPQATNALADAALACARAARRGVRS